MSSLQASTLICRLYCVCGISSYKGWKGQARGGLCVSGFRATPRKASHYVNHSCKEMTGTKGVDQDRKQGSRPSDRAWASPASCSVILGLSLPFSGHQIIEKMVGVGGGLLIQMNTRGLLALGPCDFLTPRQAKHCDNQGLRVWQCGTVVVELSRRAYL